ncbi:glycosyltransferase family 2 protein [Ferrimicrobium sp.]|uniref:glycosyltransferase family 2 protein n=1 Tax=Ferrimicrobium sp. TaxID=2926050 RepID=UPI00262CF1E1|nr:glycosyltransferase family 2 protein [Ferrimicrobium sp.]
MKTTVAAIIVLYRSGSTDLLVEELAAQGVATIVLIDNGATEPGEWTSTFANCVVHRVAFGQNLGYGLAVNRGLAMIEESMVLIMNPDVVLHTGAVDALVATAASSGAVGAVGPKVLDSDGGRYPSFRRFPSLWQSIRHGAIGWLAPESSATRSYRMSDLNPSTAVTVPWISGACLLCRTDVIRRVGGFDPKYHLYLEDVDLCRRMALFGYQIVYEPRAVVTHVGGTSSSQRRLGAVVEHHRSMATYASLEQRSTLLLFAVEIGVGLRCAMSVIRTIITGTVRN